MIRVKIALVNESSVLTDEIVASYAEVYQKQVWNDLRHYWLADAVVFFAPKGMTIAPDVWEIHFQNGLDVQGALGYHDITKGDVPVSLIGAQIDLDNGYSPSITGSHELCEMLCDPYVAGATQIGDTAFIATEVCDPCEADEFGYLVHDRLGDGIAVSDFITPQWFIKGSPGPWDFAGHHKAPLTLLPGGYTSVWTPKDKWQQITAQMKPNVRARNSLRSWGRAVKQRDTIPAIVEGTWSA